MSHQATRLLRKRNFASTVSEILSQILPRRPQAVFSVAGSGGHSCRERGVHRGRAPGGGGGCVRQQGGTVCPVLVHTVLGKRLCTHSPDVSGFLWQQGVLMCSDLFSVACKQGM